MKQARKLQGRRRRVSSCSSLIRHFTSYNITYDKPTMSNTFKQYVPPPPLFPPI